MSEPWKHDPLARFKGHKQMLKKLERLTREAPSRVEGALAVEAEIIMTDSKQNYVPVDLATLKNSGHVGKPERKGRDVQVVLSYGGAAKEYAMAVHEHPSTHSPPSWQGVNVEFRPEGRGPKYLEKPMMAAIPGMPERIMARLITE